MTVLVPVRAVYEAAFHPSSTAWYSTGSGFSKCSQSTTQCQQPAHQWEEGVQWSTSSGFASNWLVFTM
jgi:hypothetical protein